MRVGMASALPFDRQWVDRVTRRLGMPDAIAAERC